MRLETVALLDRFVNMTRNGSGRLTLAGGDGNDLLRRRIIAEYSGESETLKTDNADDMMKELVTEALVNNADYSGTPTLSRSVSDFLTVEGDETAGVSMTKAFAWRNLLQVLQDIQAQAQTEATSVYFAMVPVSESNFRFETAVNTPGRDRTVTTGTNPIIFSAEFGNVDAPALTYDYAVEENVVYAGGKGEGTDREVQTASDTDRVNASPLSRREAFHGVTNAETAAAVTSAAEARLTRRRRQIIFDGKLLSTPRTPYGGNGWDLGDKVTVSHAGVQFDSIIRSVTVRVTGDGRETITGRVENVNA